MKDIKGYEGLYAITRDGRVWSYRRLSKFYSKFGNISYRFIGGKWLSPKLNSLKDNKGYYKVSLNKNGDDQRFFIHKLVAKNFIEKKKKNLQIQVNHKNGIKTDNKVNNLEWCTPSENTKHSFLIGTSIPMRGSKNPKAKLQEKDVFKIFKLYKEKNLTQEKISLIFNVCRSTISHILNKRNWTWLN